MKPVKNKFRLNLMIGVIVMALPLAAQSAPGDCKEDHTSPMPPGVIAMHSKMMHMQQFMLAPPVGATMMPPPPFLSNGEFIPPLPPGLNLSESQQDKIFELLHSQEPTARAQHKTVRKVADAMTRLTASDHYSPSEIRPLADKLAKAIADTVVLRTETDAGIRALLTHEQRKQAEEIRARFMADLGHDEIPPQ